MSSPRQDSIELAKRKPVLKLEDILTITLDKKSLHKFLTDLIDFSQQQRQPDETLRKAFDRLFIATIADNPSKELLYRLFLLKNIELSKFANDLYAGARHNAAFYSVNKNGSHQYTLEEIFSDPEAIKLYKFHGKEIDINAEELISKNNKIQEIAETIHRRAEIKEQLELLFQNQLDFHACMNIILNFNEDVSNLFPNLPKDQLKLELESFQTDFVNDSIPDLRVFEVLDMVTSSVALRYQYDPDEYGLRILENLKAGVEKFNYLLSIHLNSKKALSPVDRAKTQAYIGTLLEKDFFPNAQLRLKMADIVKEIEQYGALKRTERNIPKSDTSLNFSVNLRKLARQYFSTQNKTDADKAEFVGKVKEIVADARKNFAATYKAKRAKGGLMAIFKSPGSGPKLFDKVDSIIATLDSPKSQNDLSKS